MAGRHSQFKNSYLPLRDLDKAKPANKINSIAYSKDSILKSKDITLLAKVHIVKANVFLVVMYGCESWTVKKAERRRIDALNPGVGEAF